MNSGQLRKSAISLELSMRITCMIAYMNGNIYLYHVPLMTLNSKEFRKYKNYFLIQDYSVTIGNPHVKFYTLVNNIYMEGTVSQIFDICLSSIFMSKNGKIWMNFSIFIFYIS